MVGGVVSGGLNFASMLPMAKRLAVSLDKANFDYTEDEIMADYLWQLPWYKGHWFAADRY